MDNQGTGGIESSGRNPRRPSVMSDPSPKTHDEKIEQESPGSDTTSAESEEQSNKYGQSDSPRHLFTPASTPDPATVGVLSRPASTCSAASENVTAAYDRYQQRGEQRTASRRRSQQHHSPRPLDRPQSSRPPEPPVTKATLSELDVNKIIHNPKLRHDINFDPELHFRPNLDGDKGRKKQEKANIFWRTLRQQLQHFVTDPVDFQSHFGQGPAQDWCLPQLLRSVKEIIQTLVPAKDRDYLEEGLNIELIMQQFNKGVADLEKLASWLSGVLKSHCAPMRDEWVDDMHRKLTNGNRNNDMDELVHGLRSLLNVLEAMKLDVANHQIRCLRPILIEDTVEFEKRYFGRKIDSGKVNPVPAQVWYGLANQQHSPSQSSREAFGDTAVFFEAFLSYTLPSKVEKFPDNFMFDEERILKIRADMLDAVNLDVCMHVYERLERDYRDHGRLCMTSIPMPPPFLVSPTSESSGYMSDDSASDFNVSANGRSRPSSMVFSTTGSTNSSPRSSLMPAPNPRPSAAELRTKSRNLYNSLVALLQTSPQGARANQRWKAMKDSLALQIFRFTDAPPEALLRFEQQLNQHVTAPASPLFLEAEQRVYQRMLAELQKRVKQLRGLTGVCMFSVATGGRIPAARRPRESHRERSGEHRPLLAPSREAREEGSVEDMATRLAHVGLLHWRVWSDLIYQRVSTGSGMVLD